jgi:ERO1-like protein alpha
MCHSESCAVCECDPEDVPPEWRHELPAAAAAAAAPALAAADGCHDPSATFEQTAALSRLAPSRAAVELDFAPWAVPAGEAERHVWLVQDEASPTLQYVDLLANPEGWTGYAGPSARRVWRAMYEENCFGADACLEERVFARVLSGLHASISTHIALTRLGHGPDGRDVALWVERVGAHPARVMNLYFAFLFVVRAVAKAAPLLARLDLATGVPEDDARARTLLAALVDAQTGAAAVLRGFDESAMFRVRRDELVAECPEVLHGLHDVQVLHERYLRHAAAKAALKDQFRDKFRNMSRILDCVGCERCRMWGKLQFLGLGTALKILFADEAFAGGEAPATEAPLELDHNEVVALINVLHRLSISVAAVQELQRKELDGALQTLGARAAAALLVAVLAAVLWRWARRPSRAAAASHDKAE